MPNNHTDSQSVKKNGDNSKVRVNNEARVTPNGSKRVTYFEVPDKNGHIGTGLTTASATPFEKIGLDNNGQLQMPETQKQSSQKKWTPIGNRDGRLVKSSVGQNFEGQDDVEEGKTEFVSPISYLANSNKEPSNTGSRITQRKLKKMMSTPGYLSPDEVRQISVSNKSMLNPKFHFNVNDLMSDAGKKEVGNERPYQALYHFQGTEGESLLDRPEDHDGDQSLGISTNKKSQLYGGLHVENQLSNGVKINDDFEELKKQNDFHARTMAKIARGDNEYQLPIELLESRSLPEYFAEMLQFTPDIMQEASQKGDPYDRFKISLKFAMSILFLLQSQNVIRKEPMIPIVGETFEAFYFLNDQTNIFMEADYSQYTVLNKVTLKVHKVNNDEPTVFLHIQGSQNEYSVSGNLSYKSEWLGNNRVVQFIGCLKLNFFDLEGQSQTVEIQMPDFVDANYYFSGKPRYALINGHLSMEDKQNLIKCVVFFKGLEKHTTLCTDVWVANTKSKDLMKGVIYKQNLKKYQRLIANKKEIKVDKIQDLGDIDFIMAHVSGNLDNILIDDFPLTEQEMDQLRPADPIPTTLALPSDCRFREDLISLRRGDIKGGKTFKKELMKQQDKDMRMQSMTPGRPNGTPNK